VGLTHQGELLVERLNSSLHTSAHTRDMLTVSVLLKGTSSKTSTLKLHEVLQQTL
jgi:tRNA pseudouridine-54 N-methylase